MAGGADDAAPKEWERPWSVEEMRKSSGNWSLASDAGMLQYLQEFSQKMTSRTHTIQEEVNGLVHELKLSDVRVSNVFNDFIMLANTQFVENRVYDEDITTEEDSKKNEDLEKTKEERESELIPKISEAIAQGMSVMDTAFETLDVNEAVSDSEDEDTPYKTDPILEPKDPYLSRPLPHLIGSPAFYQTDDVGLVEETSDKEESVAGTESESESDKSESESEEDDLKATPPPIRRQSNYSSQTDSEAGSDLFGEEKEPEEEYLSGSDKTDSEGEEGVIAQEQAPPVQPASFADELNAKLGGVVPPAKAKTKPEKKTKKRAKSIEKTAEKTQESDNEDLFGSSKQYDDDDDEDGFSNQNGLFSTKGGLFDDEPEEGGLFGEEQETKPKKQTTSEHVEHTSINKETAKAKPKHSSKKKKAVVPESGDSDEGDNLFGGSSKSNDVKSKPSIPKDSSGLFDEGSDEDLFASLSSTKDSKPAQKTVSRPKAKAPLLEDSDDDDGDLFKDGPAQQPQSESDEPESTPEPEPPKKKLPAGAVSMFGGAQNPFAAIVKSKRQEESSESEEENDSSEDEVAPTHSTVKQPSSHLPSGGPLRSEPQVVTPSSGLFNNKGDDDLFGVGAEKTSKPSTAVKVEPKSEKKPQGAPSLFDEVEDEEDDFFSVSKPARKDTPKASQAQKEPTVPKSKTLLLEDEGDDGDDLFGSAAAKPAKKKPIGGVSIFGEGFNMPGPKADKAKSPVTTPEPARPTQKKASLSLFDEEDEGDGGDLFGGGMPSSPIAKPAKAKPAASTKTEPVPTQTSAAPTPTSDNLFGAPDNLFGSSPEEDDLFHPSQSRSKPPQPVVSPPKVSKPSPTAPLLSSPEEEDLFKTLPVKSTNKARSVNPVSSSPEGSDLFKTRPATIAVNKPKPSKPTSTAPLLSSPEEEDLFKTQPVKSVVSKAVSTRPVTTAPLLSSPEEEDDLFKSLPVKTLPVHKTSVQKPPAPGRPPKTKSNQVPRLEPVKSYIRDEPLNDPLNLGATVDTVHKTSAGPPAKDPGESTTGPTISTVKPASQPGRTTGLAKTKATLNINPAALLPGAKPPTKVVEPPPVGFEDSAKTDTLEHLGKSRAKIQTKRRPPTRRTRQGSQDDTSNPPSTPQNNIDPADHGPVTTLGPGSVMQPVTPDTGGDDLFSDEDEDQDDLFGSNRKIPQHIETGKTPLTDDPLLGGDALAATGKDDRVSNGTNQTATHQTKESSPDMESDVLITTTPGGNSEVSQNQKSKGDDMVNNQTTGHNNETGTRSTRDEPPPADELFDDPFGEAIAKTKNLFGDDSGTPSSKGIADIFGSSNAKTIKKQPALSTPLVVDDEDDMFGAKPPPLRGETKSGPKLEVNQSEKAPKKPASSAIPVTIDDDEDDLFGTKPPPFPEEPTSGDSPRDDGDDIFGIPNSTSTKVPNTASAVSFDDDLFGDSSKPVNSVLSDNVKSSPPPLPVDDNDDDIFNSSVKPAAKKPVSRPTIDDDDDIFASTPKSEQRPSKKVPPTKDEDLFADDTDIFASTPSVKKSKMSGKTPSNGKSIFKDDTDDIFSDSASKPKKATAKKTTSERKAVPPTMSTDIFSDPLQDDDILK